MHTFPCDVCLLLCSLYDAYSDEMGVVDFSRSQNGSGMASQSQVIIIIKHTLDLYGYPIPKTSLL